MKVNLRRLCILLIIFIAIVLLWFIFFNKADGPIKLKKEVFVYEYGTEKIDFDPSQFLIADDDVLSDTVLKMSMSEEEYLSEEEYQNSSIIYDNSGNVIAVNNLQVGEYTFIAKYKNNELKFIIKIV